MSKKNPSPPSVFTSTSPIHLELSSVSDHHRHRFHPSAGTTATRDGRILPSAISATDSERSSALQTPLPQARASSSSCYCSPPFPPRLAPPKSRRQPCRSATTLNLPVPPTPVYRGVRQRSWGSWVEEITDRNTKKKVRVGSFQSVEQAARAYDIKNVRLHGSECGELNFPLGVEGPVPDVVAEGLRFVCDRERREDRKARERRDAAKAAALADHNPELVEEERKLLEAYAEAKRKADTAAGKKVKKEEDAGPLAAPASATVKEEEEDVPSSTTPAVIELDSDSSSYDWDED